MKITALCGVLMVALAACTSTAPTTTTSTAVTTTTLPRATTTAAPADTTTVPSTTTTSTSTTTTTIPLTIDAIEVDLATPCGVVEGWLAYASIDAWPQTWELTHPFSQTGPPLDDGGGGYGSLEDAAYQDETAMTAAAVGVDVECSFADFGNSFGESVGVVTVTGEGDTGASALAVPMRTEGEQWKVDNFAGHVSIVSPDPFGEAEPDERVVFVTPLGTFDTLVVVDGTTRTAVLVENPVNPDEGIGTWVPTAPFGLGVHVVTVASMLENGILAAQSVQWTVP